MLETLFSEASNESKAPHHQPLPNNRPRWDEILHSSFTFVADSPCLVGPCASWSLCQLSKEWRDALDTGRGDLWAFASCDLSCDSYRSSINDKSFEEEPSRQHASTKTLTYKSKQIISMPIYSSLTKHTWRKLHPCIQSTTILNRICSTTNCRICPLFQGFVDSLKAQIFIERSWSCSHQSTSSHRWYILKRSLSS